MDAATLYETLRKELASAQPDLKKCEKYLSQLKIHLASFSYLSVNQQNLDLKNLLLARDILETGAQWSIRADNIPAFERYIQQLETYYRDYRTLLPDSQRMYPLIGLNLLRLLAQNRISAFHTALETIDPSQLHENIYIRHPVQMEQSLMEGSYNKVWNARQDVPAPEYLFFIDILVETIRHEIATCSERAYATLPLSDAATLLFFDKLEDILVFASDRGWRVEPMEKMIYFHNGGDVTEALPSAQIIKRTLSYARELEQIV